MERFMPGGRLRLLPRHPGTTATVRAAFDVTSTADCPRTKISVLPRADTTCVNPDGRESNRSGGWIRRVSVMFGLHLMNGDRHTLLGNASATNCARVRHSAAAAAWDELMVRHSTC